MKEKYFTALRIDGMSTPNKVEMANILIAIAEWIKQSSNKRVQVTFKVEFSK